MVLPYSDGVVGVGFATAKADVVAGATCHLLNHALFKALLFLCAGAIVHVTGKTHLFQMGGLANKMPWLAGAFVFGVLAISGNPRLNGYVSVGLIHEPSKKLTSWSSLPSSWPRSSP